jgi:uncharacterized protein (TIGR02466 family)
MNVTSDLLHLFPIPVGRYNFYRKFTEEEIDYIKNISKSKNLGNKKSADGYVLKNEALADISEFCDVCVKDYFDKIHKPTPATNIKITQSWLNYTEKSEFHHRHTHPNSFISGVLYIQSDDKQDKILFYDSKYQQLKIRPSEFNIYNSSSWWFESITGQLLLFPSSLEHTVEPRPNIDYTRISLSFNTFLTGKLGEDNSLDELIL